MIMRKDSGENYGWLNDNDDVRRQKQPQAFPAVERGRSRDALKTSSARMPNGDPPGVMLWGDDGRDQ